MSVTLNGLESGSWQHVVYDVSKYKYNLKFFRIIQLCVDTKSVADLFNSIIFSVTCFNWAKMQFSNLS